jgi:hypothetical protein
MLIAENSVALLFLFQPRHRKPRSALQHVLARNLSSLTEDDYSQHKDKRIWNTSTFRAMQKANLETIGSSIAAAQFIQERYLHGPAVTLRKKEPSILCELF